MKNFSLLWLLLGVALCAEGAGAQGLSQVQMNLGGFGVGKGTQPALETGIEAHFRAFPFRIGRFALKAQPILGYSLNEDQGRWIYAGTRTSVTWGRRWVVSPSFAVAHYERGDGARLGSELEFRSAIELAARVGKRFEIGLELYHLSNGRTARKNPGSESLVLTFRAPFLP